MIMRFLLRLVLLIALWRAFDKTVSRQRAHPTVIASVL